MEWFKNLLREGIKKQADCIELTPDIPAQIIANKQKIAFPEAGFSQQTLQEALLTLFNSQKEELTHGQTMEGSLKLPNNTDVFLVGRFEPTVLKVFLGKSGEQEAAKETQKLQSQGSQPAAPQAFLSKLKQSTNRSPQKRTRKDTNRNNNRSYCFSNKYN